MKTLKAGFTLIELVVVIVILGILAAVAVPQFTNLAGEARTAVVTSTCGAAHSSAVLLFASTKAANTSAAIQSNITTGEGVSVSISGCNITVTPPGGSATACSSAIPASLCSG